MVFLFLRVKRPEGTIKEKLAKLDPMNLVFIPAATATTLGLQWSTSYGWASYKVSSQPLHNVTAADTLKSVLCR